MLRQKIKMSDIFCIFCEENRRTDNIITSRERFYYIFDKYGLRLIIKALWGEEEEKSDDLELSLILIDLMFERKG